MMSPSQIWSIVSTVGLVAIGTFLYFEIKGKGKLEVENKVLKNQAAEYVLQLESKDEIIKGFQEASRHKGERIQRARDENKRLNAIIGDLRSAQAAGVHSGCSLDPVLVDGLYQNGSGIFLPDRETE